MSISVDPDSVITIGLATPHDTTNPNAFSGTARAARRALEACPGVALRLIAPRRRLAVLPGRVRRLVRAPMSTPTPRSGDLEGLDAIVGLVATRILDRLPPDAPPYLHVSDATPAFLRDLYGRQAEAGVFAAETRVAARAAACIYSSSVMAARAPSDLGLPDLAPLSLPFGVNLDTRPSLPPRKPPLDKPRLLFVGKNWHRKGGDVAAAALARLRGAGVDAVLDVVGPDPQFVPPQPGLRAHGYLDKARADAAARLARLYAEAHLLVLPTRGDCTPMVIAEAMAHATPALVSDTGGVADLIGGAGAGRLLPPEATPDDWANNIRAMLDPAAHELLRDAAFERAAAELGWQAWAAQIADLARHAATRHAAACKTEHPLRNTAAAGSGPALASMECTAQAG